MAKENYVRTLSPYFVKRTEEPFWSYSHPQNLLQNGDFEAWSAGSAVGDEPDGWTESGVGDVQREAGTVKRCNYSAELTHPGGAGGSTLYQSASCAQFYRGLYVSLSAWVYADDADRVRLSIADGVTSTYSEYHPGDGAWWLLTVVKLIDGAANQVTMSFRIEAGAGAVVAWVDAAHLCLGPVPRGFANKPLYDDGTVTIERGVITKDVQEGDPRQVYSIGGVAKAITGVDDDDGDKFKIAIGTSVLGTAADVITIDPATKFLGVGQTVPGAILEVKSSVDAISNRVAVFSANSRVAPADDDEGYISFELEGDAGIEEYARMNFIAKDVITGSKEGGFSWDVMGGNALREVFSVYATQPFHLWIEGAIRRDGTFRINEFDSGGSLFCIISTGEAGFGGIIAPLAQVHIDQASTTAAIPVLLLDQADLSEEFIELTTTVGAGNPIDTAALGAYYGKMRVNVTGVGYKWIPLYN